jgi:hypothetical protein
MHVVSAPVLEAWDCLADEQIVVRVVGGQTALFEVLMRRHNERLYRAARAIVKDESEAEHVMQQAVVKTRLSRARAALAASCPLRPTPSRRTRSASCARDAIVSSLRVLARIL